MGERLPNISRRTFLGGAAAIGIASVLDPLMAFAAPTAAEKQAEADAVRIKLASLHLELREKENAYGAALDARDQAIIARDDAQARMDETNAHIAELQKKLGTRARSMYRNGAGTFLDILFGATSFTDFATNWDLLSKMNNDDAAMVAETKALRAEFQSARDEYDRQEKIAAEKLEEARQVKETAEALTVQYQALLDSLDAEAIALFYQEQELAAIAAAEEARRRAESEAARRPPSTGVTDPGYNWQDHDFGPAAPDILSEAVKYVGIVPYVWGGNDPSTGFDCSGLVCYCCRRTGHAVPPRTTYGYPNSGWFPVSEAQPGDILWQPDHVGICASAGGGSYVHAANEYYGICYGSSQQFTRAYRY